MEYSESGRERQCDNYAHWVKRECIQKGESRIIRLSSLETVVFTIKAPFRQLETGGTREATCERREKRVQPNHGYGESSPCSERVTVGVRVLTV